MNLFELATRKSFQFPSRRGPLTVQDLWKLPLVTSAKDGVSLDLIAQDLNEQLQKATKAGFVKSQQAKPDETYLQERLNIVIHIIKVKEDEDDLAKKKAEASAQLNRFLELAAKKQADKDAQMSEEELAKKIKELMAVANG